MQQLERKKMHVWSSAFFALAIHAAIVGVLMMSFEWQSKKPLQVAEVTLWDQLPQPVQPPKVVKEPPPEKKPAPKPEPKPAPVVEEKVEPTKPTAAEIALENKKKKEALAKKKRELEKKKKKEAARKKREKLKKLKASLLKEEKDKKAEALKQLQKTALDEERAEKEAKANAAKAAVNASIVEQYMGKISNKIKGYVNRALCGDGNPTLTFKVGLLPTGQLSGQPSIVKSSGIPACDDAVLRAILAAEPLPLPEERTLYSKFRNLELTFKPNE